MSNVSSLAQAACLAYFETFLPTLRNQLLIEDLRDLSCAFAFRIFDSGMPPWRAVVHEGRLTEVGQEGPEPQCVFVCDMQTMLAVVSGGLPPQEAFFAQRVEMEGDLELALRLAMMLAPFFERFPFKP
jgi:predicted lipid carrier protein YhbT